MFLRKLTAVFILLSFFPLTGFGFGETEKISVVKEFTLIADTENFIGREIPVLPDVFFFYSEEDLLEGKGAGVFNPAVFFTETIGFEFFGFFDSEEEKSDFQLLKESLQTEDFRFKKIMYIDSGSVADTYNDGFVKAFEETVAPTQAKMRIHRMNLKYNLSVDDKKKAGKEAMESIEDFIPDIVVFSGDAAAVHLINRYYSKVSRDFIYCGMDWDAGKYGYPTERIKGIAEKKPVAEIISEAESLGLGGKAGYLGCAAEEENRDFVFAGTDADSVIYYAVDYEDWKEKYKKLQSEAGYVILGDVSQLPGWDYGIADSFLAENTEKPTFSFEYGMGKTVVVNISEDEYSRGEQLSAIALNYLKTGEYAYIEGEIPEPVFSLNEDLLGRSSLSRETEKALRERYGK